MRKMITTLAAVAASAAFADGITSQNVVGYQSFDNGDWIKTIGAAFSPMNGSGKWTCSDKIFDTTAVAGDTLMVFNSTAWDFDSYLFNGFNGSGDSLGWAFSTNDIITGDPIESVVASFDLQKGSFGYFSPSDGTSGVNVSGEVDNADTTTSVTFTGDWIYNLMNPYPVATTLGDLETFFEAGDTLMVFNSTAWDFDSYVYNGSGLGWAYSTNDIITGDAIESVVTDSTTVVLESGVGGYYSPSDSEKSHTWTASVK